MTEISDKYLLTRLSEGRKDAYEELFARYYTKVRKFIGSVLFDSVDADDLAQNVFLKVWERRRDLAAVDSLDAYLFTVARNEVCDCVRKHKVNEKFLDSVKDPDDYISDMRIEYDTRKITDIVSECVGNMPPQRRMCFVMSREMHLTSQKIAERLNISKRTVDRHLSLALKDIRDALGKVLSGIVLFIVSCWI